MVDPSFSTVAITDTFMYYSLPDRLQDRCGGGAICGPSDWRNCLTGGIIRLLVI
jgi:hypothetical protein